MTTLKTGVPAFHGLARALIVAVLSLAGAAAQSQDGVSKSTIVIGQSVALTGPAASLGAPFAQGAKLFFDRVNAGGGINGRKVELVTLDDAGNPATTLANTQKLLAQGVFSLFGYYGSPQVTAAYPAIKDSDVILFAPMSAADEFRGWAYPNIYTIRPGYSEEAAAILRHAETLGARKLAILYAADGESLAALDASERTMQGRANLVARAPITDTAKALAAQPESVLLIGDARAAAAAIRELRGKGFRGPIYGYSNTGESLLAEQLGAVGAGVVVVRVVPRSDNLKLAVVRDLHADMLEAKMGRSNVYMLEGYIAARTYTEALRRIPKDPTRAKLRKSIDGMDEVSVGGFRIHFTQDRVASKLVELSLIDSQGKIRE
ncbi:ABC transporter substrate-binding protein [Polaromonas sp.]|uniref:ABC transporter substrate-binding protein n=1 Tax=Polaromonas sp. TaxID=1869339 RepID=UPI003BA9E411